MTSIELSPKSQLPEVLKKITAELVKTDHSLVRPVTLPERVVVTAEVEQAFISYPRLLSSTVCPETKRVLSQGEIDDLIAEREAIDQMQKVLDRRKDAIRTATFNHLDLVADPEAEYTDKGFSLVAGQLRGSTKMLTREVQSGSVELTAENLLLEEGSEGLGGFVFEHGDFLACTKAVRVIDELKVLQQIRDNPSIQPVLARATKIGSPILKHSIRKL